MINKQSVLVIDDSPPLRRLAESTLTQEGFDVITASDEESGLEAARKELPSLILVDLAPNMDSYRFCKNIRLDSTLHDVPIVFLSSGDEINRQEHNEKFSNVQYIQKSSETEALAKILRDLMAGREDNAASGTFNNISDNTTANGSPEEIDSLPVEIPMPEVTLRDPMTVRGRSEYDSQDTSSEEGTYSHDSMEFESMLSDMKFVDISTSEANPSEDTPEDTGSPSPDSAVHDTPRTEAVIQEESDPAAFKSAGDVSCSKGAHQDTLASETFVAHNEKAGGISGNESVLVIDDSPTVRRLAELVLAQEGYKVFTAEDGDVGLEIAQREMPSIVLVDFIMPKMNGFQLCKSIRTDPALRDIPIVLITSKGEEVGQGFDEKFSIAQYLKKPFETETLTKTVREVLAGRKEKPEARAEDRTSEGVRDGAAPQQEPLETETAPPAVPSAYTSAGETSRAEDMPQHAFTSETPVVHTPAHKDKPRSGYDEAVTEYNGKDPRHYFGQELSVLLKSTVTQALKEAGLLHSSSAILSGEMSFIHGSKVLQFISMSGLSGKLSVLTSAFSAELYFENGQIIFAGMSKTGRNSFLEELMSKEGKVPDHLIASVFTEAGGNNIAAGKILLDRKLITSNELSDYYRRLSEEAVNKTNSATSGKFSLEDVPIPREIKELRIGIPVSGTER